MKKPPKGASFASKAKPKASPKAKPLPKRKPKKLDVKVHGKNPELDKIIHDNLISYFQKRKLKIWGNSNLDPDKKGFDGYDSLYLTKYVSKQIKTKLTAANAENSFVDNKEVFIKAATRNAWQWANFCSRLWAETQTIEPPIRRLVEIKLNDLLPCAEYGIVDPYLHQYKDFKTSMRNLGLMKSKVRLLLSFNDANNLSAKDCYKLFDALGFVASEKSIWGLLYHSSKSSNYTLYSRETTILCPNDLRKSKEADRYISEAIDLGYRVVLPFDILKGDKSSIKEIKSSPLYSKLCASWKGLQPIVTISVDSPMARKKKLGMISKIADILLV